MLQGEQDEAAVYRTVNGAATSLLMWVFGNKGVAYVLGDEHYERLILGAPILIQSRYPRYGSGGARDFIASNSENQECKGFIPATQAALEAITAEGMKVIKQGLVSQNIPYFPDGTRFDVYR